MDLRSTLNLPDADFTIPMKAGLPELEPKLLAQWENQAIYHEIQASRKDAPLFVLHDGPPYTNSPVHIGTAMNKILKDFVVKSHTMMGFRSPYVPGFDNHGLPIEQAVQKKLAAQKIVPTQAELRQACRDHAREFINIQTEQFKRLGVFGLWEKPYETMDFKYEAGIVRVFKRLVEGGYVYKGLRPTLWSPTSRTALADTEIVYHDHVSKAIYVRFPLKTDPNRHFDQYPNLYTVIWTTTPWTIPANLAVAFHPEFKYAIVRVGSDHYLLLEDLVAKVAEKVGWTDYEVVDRMEGINFSQNVFKHPIFDRDSIAVMADYVTTEDGTGVVHTAPSHGRDDFFTGQKYGLPVPNTVDERGVLTAEAGEFEGTYFKDCDVKVVDRLRELGMLLSVEDYHHSYPYAERDDQPVIFRATEQWFVSIDHDNLRGRMLTSINPEGGVRWVPANGYNRIEAMVSHRPDWCVSRQRPWGVGVPVFYGAKSREPVLDPVAIESVAQATERMGSGAWFELDAKDLLPEGYVQPTTGETEFVKETDVLDVWFDSGCTSLNVLTGDVYPEWEQTWPADVYLEGSDQHRGWFNTSLILGTAIMGGAPYKQVVTHGFVTDEQGRKMSKRLGNVVDPVKACEQFGADVIRYWVASVDYANDAPCSDNLLKTFGNNYRTVRNTFRFLLGNLYDFEPDNEALSVELDQWIVEQTDLLVRDCQDAYNRYDFGTVITSLHNFCAIELSRFYLDAIKDRMYCDGADWGTRRSGQRACWKVLTQLVKLAAPILCFTAEETWAKIPGVTGSVHTQNFDVPSDERLAEIEGNDLQTRFATVLAERGDAFAAFEPWKAMAEVKDSQNAVLEITQAGETYSHLRSFPDEDLAIFFKVSWVTLKEGAESYVYSPTTFAECARSRLRRPDVTEVTYEGEQVFLTARDQRAIGIS
jgi:isoleucyl-tRNA synthetase